MSDQLLTILRVCLLVLMYLVFLRVLRAVGVELRAGTVTRRAPAPDQDEARAPVPASVGAGPAAPNVVNALVVIEPLAWAGTTFALDAETTIGRAAGCRISIDDTHVSKIHARVFAHEDRWFVEDLGSTNGTLLNEVLVGGSVPLEPGDLIRVGATVMELR